MTINAVSKNGDNLTSTPPVSNVADTITLLEKLQLNG